MLVPGPVVVVGDSFATGTGALVGHGYPDYLRMFLARDVRVVAAGGCGFVNRGRWGTHRCRRWMVPRKTEILVIQSSANDRRFPPHQIKRAMNDYLDGVARISHTMIFGAIWCGEDDRELLHMVSRVAEDVATERSLPFVDTRRWPTAPDLYRVDGHPTDAGHRMIAEKIAAAVLKQWQ